MVELDQGNLSTVAISVVGALAAGFFADPQVLQDLLFFLLGSAYLQYGTMATLVIVTLWNIFKPRNPKPVEVEEGVE